MQAVVTPGDQQEDSNNGVDGRAVEVADASVVSREPANRNRRKAVSNRIESRHPGKPQGQRTGDGQ
ncbi:hypothetical protein D3C76_1337420 [compost metagenome]